jgi:MFS family permease
VLSPLHLHVTLMGLHVVAYGGLRLAMTLRAIEHGASAATIGVLVAIFGLGPALTSIALGRWVDRVGPRVPLIIASAGLVLSVAIGWLWRDLAGFFIAAAIIGVCWNLYYVAQQPVLGRFGAADTVANFSLAGLAVAFGSFVGPALTGSALDAFGYGGTLPILILFPLLPLAVLLGNRLRLPEMKPAQPAGKSGSALALIVAPRLRTIYVLAATAGSAWQMLLFLLPLVGVALGLSATLIGLAVGALPLASAASRLVAPLAVRRFKVWPVVVASLACTAAGMALLPFAGSFATLMLCSLWLGFWLGIGNPLGQALLYEVAPKDRLAEALGVWAMLASTAQTVAPLVSGVIAASVGIGPVFWLLALGLAGCSWMGRKRRE